MDESRPNDLMCMAGDRVSGKPPRPRLSQSPSSASSRNDRRHQLNCLTSKQNEINQLQFDINKSKTDFVNINCFECPDSQDSISVVSQGNEDYYDYDIQKSPEINRRQSIYSDNEDGDKSEEKKEDTKASLAKDQISQWIDQILKPSEHLNNPSIHPIKLDYNHKPDSVYSQTLNPEDDILTQWRLRRRMEQAQLEVSKESFHKSNGYAQLTTPFPGRNLSQYRQFFSQTKSLAYNTSPCGLSTIDESTKSSSIKVYIKDTSIQCDLLKHFQMDDSQVQTNHSVFNASFNCCKSLNLYNKSTMHEIGTMTDKNISEACLKVRHKSIRLMVRPQSRNVRLQTPHNMILCNMTRPMSKNVCISVDKTQYHRREQQQATTTATLNNDASVTDNNTLMNCIPHSLPVDESFQSVDSDSWLWPTTPPSSIKSDKNSNQLIGNIFDSNHNAQERKCHQLHATGSPEETSSRSLSHLLGLTTTEHTASKSTIDREVQIGLTISRYMEENLNNVEQPDEKFLEDEILQDLRERRTKCLLKMKLVMKQIHERETQLLNNSNKLC
ncbi:hypothetical protein MN116_002862 [Schistosoma mekongi]|uniref:Uncharacterized protein n=1 Tax=Schistosoma mekongi TaxID=38744 RepID=A0AAE2D6Y7_SCHME|nr:hypothetical protein MN116_002862 [Schistosoma mekongi]